MNIRVLLLLPVGLLGWVNAVAATDAMAADSVRDAGYSASDGVSRNTSGVSQNASDDVSQNTGGVSRNASDDASRNTGRDASTDLEEALLATMNDDETLAANGALWEDALQDLEAFRAAPLDLNTATREDLSLFPFLSAMHIAELLAYRTRYGALASVQELQLVGSFDFHTIQRLRPFVEALPVNNTPTLRQDLQSLFRRAYHETLLRVDVPLYSRAGYREVSNEEYWAAPNRYYLGPNVAHSLRYSFRSGTRLRIGLTASNDYGEPFFTGGNRQGYDSYSFYAYYRGDGFLRTLALGKYRAAMGQGLIMGSGFLTGKLTSLPTNTGNMTALRPHSSIDEYNYLNGAATTLALTPRLALTALYSHRSLDGRTDDSTLLSIQTDGYHRLQREMERRNAVTLQTVGGTLHYEGTFFRLAANAVGYQFGKDYQRAPTYYNTHYFRGRNGHNLSLDYRMHFRRVFLTGELATDPGGHLATLHSIRYNLPHNWHLMSILRHYNYRYQAHYAKSFQEGGYTQNESGLYLGVEGSPAHRWHLTAFADVFRFPEPKYQVHAPSNGYELFLQTLYTPRREVELSAYYRYKEKGKDLSSAALPNEDRYDVVPYRTQRARLQLLYTPLPERLSLKTLLQGTIVGHKAHSQSLGYLLGQTADWRLQALPLQLNLSLFYFNTDDYASRLYAYEKGLLYSFSMPAFDGQGMRTALSLRFDGGKRWMLICKYGRTHYFDRTKISSDLQQINSRYRDDISLQLRLKV